MATTITLSDGTTTADLHALTATFVVADGWEMAGGGGEAEVGDVLNLLIQGSTGTVVQTAVAAIERLLEGARRRRDTATGARVYLTVQLDGEASSWRSEVLDGKLELPSGADQWNRRKIEARLGVTRRNEWEGPETELSISANGQSAFTGGRTVTNGSASWLQIAAAQVTGSMPSEARIELENTSGGSRSYSEIHMAVNADNDPANLAYFIEGETATGGSSSANGSASSGNVRSLTVNTSATLTFALTSANMQRTKGGPFVVLGRFQSITSGGVSVRLELQSLGVSVWLANEARSFTRTTPQLGVLGVVPLPPLGWEALVPAGIDLVLNFESESSQTVTLDYIALFPAADYRLLTMLGAGVASGAVVVDNAIDDWSGVSVSNTSHPVVSPRGKPLLLRPNVVQRIYILQQTLTDCSISDTFSARVWYRPKRLTL